MRQSKNTFKKTPKSDATRLKSPECLITMLLTFGQVYIRLWPAVKMKKNENSKCQTIKWNNGSVLFIYDQFLCKENTSFETISFFHAVLSGVVIVLFHFKSSTVWSTIVIQKQPESNGHRRLGKACHCQGPRGQEKPEKACSVLHLQPRWPETWATQLVVLGQNEWHRPWWWWLVKHASDLWFKSKPVSEETKTWTRSE